MTDATERDCAWIVEVHRAFGSTVRFGPFASIKECRTFIAEHLYVAASILPLNPPEEGVPDRVWRLEPWQVDDPPTKASR